MAMPARCASCRASEAAAIYRRLYWLRPRLDEIASRSPRLAAELFDTGVNMGPAVAVTFLQRALTALNRNAADYADLTPDGRIGPATLAALDSFMPSGATAAARPCCCARSRRSRANATSASPSGGRAIIYLTKQALRASVRVTWTTF